MQSEIPSTNISLADRGQGGRDAVLREPERPDGAKYNIVQCKRKKFLQQSTSLMQFDYDMCDDGVAEQPNRRVLKLWWSALLVCEGLGRGSRHPVSYWKLMQ
jgi:hypothetical protein